MQPHRVVQTCRSMWYWGGVKLMPRCQIWCQVVPGWCQVGVKLISELCQVMPSWCQVGARLVPIWCQIGVKLEPSDAKLAKLMSSWC